MKNLLALVLLAFAISFANAEAATITDGVFRPDRHVKYKSEKFKRKMHKRSQKAYRDMCNIKHFRSSAFGIYKQKR